MQKKLLLFIILVSLVFYSCLDYSLPNQIELELEGSINLPIKTSTSNWGAVLAEALKKAFSGSMDEKVNQIEIYNVDSGEDVQTFCMYMPIEISGSLNPSTYLEYIDNALIDLEGDTQRIEETVDIPSKVVLLNNQAVTISGTSVSINLTDIPLTIEGLFHAVIEEGFFTIIINGGDSSQMAIDDYRIEISQDDDTGNPSGNIKGFSNSPAITNDAPSLKGQNINRKLININGTINITNPDNLTSGNLTITMNISEYRELDWKMVNTDAMKTNPLSLERVAGVLNWISFDPCDENGETAGVGIRINFSEETSIELLQGLKMTVKCEALKFDGEEKPLEAENNVFGNKEEFTLYLNDIGNSPPAEVHKDLKFDITLSANSDNPEVLKLTGVKVEDDKPLSIIGEVRFFQNWKQANVIMKAVLNAEPEAENAFVGIFPPADTDPIDLSLLGGYIPGFEFTDKDLMAYAYLSGPDKTVNGNPNLLEAADPGLSIDANYSIIGPDGVGIDISSRAMDQNQLKLEKKHIVLKGNSDYLDNNGTYKYKDKNGEINLPPDGNHFDFLEALNAQPQNLRFHYNVNVPETITVEPDMFNDDEAHEIVATIIILIKMRLTAGDNGGKIKLPDMFNGMEDLLGRQADENDKPEYSVFTSLDVSYIKFAIDFAGAFFNGGTFFIQKSDDINPLFPDGISLDSSTISLDITDEKFKIVKENIIHPDFRLEFRKGGKIAIPRNMGLTSVKLEAKGKNTLTLDF